MKRIALLLLPLIIIGGCRQTLVYYPAAQNQGMLPVKAPLYEGEDKVSYSASGAFTKEGRNRGEEVQMGSLIVQRNRRTEVWDSYIGLTGHVGTYQGANDNFDLLPDRMNSYAAGLRAGVGVHSGNERVSFRILSLNGSLLREWGSYNDNLRRFIDFGNDTLLINPSSTLYNVWLTTEVEFRIIEDLWLGLVVSWGYSGAENDQYIHNQSSFTALNLRYRRYNLIVSGQNRRPITSIEEEASGLEFGVGLQVDF